MKKAIISLLLAAIMVVSLMPVMAFAEAQTFTVKDSDGKKVSEGSKTYKVKEDGIHIYSGEIIFSGETDKKVFIEGESQEATFTDFTVKNSVIADKRAENVILYLDGATIEGDVTATENGTDGLYLCFNIQNNNQIKGDVTSDGSISVYGFPNASLKVKSAKAKTLLFLDGLRLENMKEEYKAGETLTATSKDGLEPVVFAVKKEAVFPTEEEFVINNGKAFEYGEDYEIPTPIVCDENGKAFDPQPELTVVYYKLITDGEWDWEIKQLDGKPKEIGKYLITFYMPESDQYYTGSRFYEYKIGHNPKKCDGKSATKKSAGYKSYYFCEGCNKYFADADCKVEIKDLDSWKAKGGKGYLPQLKDSKDNSKKEKISPLTADCGTVTISFVSLLASFICLCGFAFFAKRKEQ